MEDKVTGEVITISISNLECEGGETDHHGGSQEESLDDDALIEEGHQNSDCVGFHDGEAGQENQIDGSLLPLDVERDEKSDGEEKCGEQEDRSGLNELLDSRSEEEHSSDQSRHGQLDREQAVHLPHEPWQGIVIPKIQSHDEDNLTKSYVLAGSGHVIVVGEVILQPGLAVGVFLTALDVHHQGN